MTTLGTLLTFLSWESSPWPCWDLFYQGDAPLPVQSFWGRADFPGKGKTQHLPGKNQRE